MFIFRFRQVVGGSGSSQVEVKRGTFWNNHQLLSISFSSSFPEDGFLCGEV